MSAEELIDFFTQLMRSEYVFLEHDYGFRYSSKMMDNYPVLFASYRSRQIEVRFVYGMPDFDMGYTISRVGLLSRLFHYAQSISASDITHYLGLQHINGHPNGYRREVMEEFVPDLAGLLRTHGGAFLRGRHKEFREITSMIKRSRSEYDDRCTALKAQYHWERGEHALALDCYARINRELTPMENKRIEYAKKHCL